MGMRCCIVPRPLRASDLNFAGKSLGARQGALTPPLSEHVEEVHAYMQVGYVAFEQLHMRTKRARGREVFGS